MAGEKAGLEQSEVGEIIAGYGSVRGLAFRIAQLSAKENLTPRINWALEGASDKLAQAEGLLFNAVEDVAEDPESIRSASALS